MNRNAAFAAFIAAISAVLLLAGCGGGSSSDGTSSQSAGGGPTEGGEINLLTWQGYAEPEWVKEFEQETGTKVNATYIGSDDEIVAKVKANGDSIDAYGGNRALVHPLAEAGLLVPIESANFKGMNAVAPEFRESKLIQYEGKQYMVPYDWGGIGLAYDEGTFPTAPESWGPVFDPSEPDCGKVLWPDDAGDMVSTAALYLGFKNPYKLSSDQLDEIQELLEKERKCVVAFYSGLGDAANYFASGRAVAALSLGAQIPAIANKSGSQVNESVPKEGALGWSDGWAMTKGAEGKEALVENWMAFAIRKKTQADLAAATSFAPVVESAASLLSKTQVENLKIGDPNYASRLVPIGFPEAPDSLEARQELWNVVKSAG